MSTIRLTGTLLLMMMLAGTSAASALQERAAAPPPEVSAQDGDDVLETILGWHAALSRHMPTPVAWAIFAAPIWLPLLLWAFVRWVRRSRAERSARAPARQVMPRLPQVSAPPELAPLELGDAEAILRATKNQPGPLELALATLGYEDNTLKVLRDELQEGFDAENWFAEDEEVVERRARLPERWVRRLARDRIESWLSEHPLVLEPELEPHMPGDLELGSLDDLCLVYSSGLGVNLDNEQKELVREARRALKLSFHGATNAFVLELVAERLKIPALIGAHEGQQVSSRYPLTALLYGESAYRQALTLGVIDSLGDDFHAQLAAARDGDQAPLSAEGPVFHLLSQLGSPPPAGGYLLTALMGGRVGIKEVTLQLSRRVKDLPANTRQALSQIGVAAAKALAKAESPPRQRLLRNLAALLGDGLLAKELEQLAEREKTLERGLARAAIWPKLKPAQSPDMVLLGLYKRQVARQREALGVAVVRALRVFRELAYAGEGRLDQDIAATRFGYALACLGSDLFAGIPELAAQVGEIRPSLL